MSTLPKFSQENVLTLLCFDDANCLLARSAVTKELFDHPYREVAEKAIDYIDRYKQPPKDHIADELESLLNSEQGEQYREILKSIYKLNENLNTKYVIDKLLSFIRERKFESALYDASNLQLKGELEEAQDVIRKSLDFNLSLFDPGTRMTNLTLLAKSLEEDNIYPSGILALDAAKVGPAPKQLFVFLGPKSCGKSWQTIQMARNNILLNHKVLHITLEISQEIVLQRYIQNLLSITRWQMGFVKSPFLIRDGNGSVIRVDHKMIDDRPSFEDEGIISLVQEKYAQFGPRLQENLIIKEFPTGQLTISHLRGYLDTLERTENFIPDIIAIDQPSNMKINRSDQHSFRIGMGGLFIDLRGLAVERNCSVTANHHINRIGIGAKITTGEHISEDISILNTADTGIVYNQRPAEKKYKLARLWVDRGRSQKSGFMILMAQNYDLGQFCLDSDVLPKGYNAEAKEMDDLIEETGITTNIPDEEGEE